MHLPMNFVESFVGQAKAGRRSTIKELEDLELNFGGHAEEDRIGGG